MMGAYQWRSEYGPARHHRPTVCSYFHQDACANLLYSAEHFWGQTFPSVCCHKIGVEHDGVDTMSPLSECRGHVLDVNLKEEVASIS